MWYRNRNTLESVTGMESVWRALPGAFGTIILTPDIDHNTNFWKEKKTS